jgi:RecB family exonuclease
VPELPLSPLGDVALRNVRHRKIVSAGALETYADCPVRWLVEKELQPDSLEPEFDAITRGSYMHDVLERTLRRLGGAVTEASLPAARRILEDVLAELPPPFAPGRSAAVRAAALRAIEADLCRYLEYEAATGCDWAPRGLELRFGFEPQEGEEESLPALELGTGDGAVRVRGAIDRVDTDPEGRRAIVRDYKSGRVRPSYPVARWRVDRRLQVALYMLVVRELLGMEPVAGLYQPLGGHDLRARGVFLKGMPAGTPVHDKDARERDELDAELADAANRAVAIAEQLRTGELTPCPETCSRDGCAYPGICRGQ